tara:strand:+ start:139 stop:252 length:114 start_codon:yes stop_codon:yes gene_type:complete
MIGVLSLGFTLSTPVGLMRDDSIFSAEGGKISDTNST